jgi:TetR/AcrR family transcriptional regulator, regulator of autoinduction and epiphytic fitness
VTDTVHDSAIDGRHARRNRGRTAVIDALFDLLQQGQFPPSSEQIAQRAGVSVSSLFRYFDNLDDLQQHTIERYFERFAPLFEVPEQGVGHLDDRIARFVDSRARLYEAIEPIARLTRSRAIDEPKFAYTLHDTRLRLAGQVRDHFAPEVSARSPQAGEDLVGSIASLTAFESWDQLHRDLTRTNRQIRRAWSSAIRALCSAP